VVDPSKALKQAEAAAGWLAKQLKAEVTVRIARHPDDPGHERDSKPCFRVNVDVWDPESPHEAWDQHWRDMSLSDEWKLRVTAEKASGFLGFLRRKRRLIVSVTGEPLDAWDKRYGPAKSGGTLRRGEAPTILLVFPPLAAPIGPDDAVDG
jgi:hypothetical protein